ncbi:MAG: RNA polymerase sigma factor [Clostridia bacterium]|nr:RNA polymerase sigma factor [Clostridia bacterium]
MENYRRYLSGDESAFDEIIRSYRHSLTFFLMRYTGDAETAEELAIDAFAELVLHPKRYNFKVSLKTYLFMLGRSRAIDRLRRQKRLLPLEEELPYEEEFLKNEQKRALHAALATLPSEMQAAVHLVYFEELTYKDAARVLKKTPKQVDNLLFRAKKLLRKELEDENE